MPDATRVGLDGSTGAVRDDFLVFGRPLITDEDIAEVVDTLRSGWLGTGPKVHALEARFAEYTGAAQAVAVSSCTAALALSLEAAGVGPGDEVVTTPITFAATANVIVHRGATPVFADIDPTTLNIDPAEVERRISAKTKAVIPVHMAGLPCRVDEILERAHERGIAVVADAAHGVEARYRGRSVALLGDAVAFSFYVTKNMTTGEGGMVTTARADWAEEFRLKSLHGLSKDAWNRYSASGHQSYETVAAGYKYNLTDLQAALGLGQLARIEANWRARSAIWQLYRGALAGVDGIILPDDDPGPEGRHARHLFVCLLDLEKTSLTRDEFIEAMRRHNIGCGVHFTPVHLHRFYRERFGFRPGDFPNAEWVGERTVSLPLSAALTPQDVDDVVSAVKRVLAAAPRRIH